MQTRTEANPAKRAVCVQGAKIACTEETILGENVGVVLGAALTVGLNIFMVDAFDLDPMPFWLVPVRLLGRPKLKSARSSRISLSKAAKRNIWTILAKMTSLLGYLVMNLRQSSKIFHRRMM